MKKFLIGCLVALFTTSAMAAGEYPPKRYDYPFKGKVIVHNYRPIHCLGTPACANMDWYTLKVLKQCHIYRDPRTSDYWWKVVGFRHEQAHCNGWPQDHPP